MTTAFIFPGQGSQAVGMLSEFSAVGQSVNERLRQASDVLGLDLLAIVQDGPAEELNKTEITQPTLLAVSYGLYELFVANGGTAPQCLAGHSLGEYTALVVSGALEFEEAISLVHQRGQLMQQAAPLGVGSMAAILGLDDDVVTQACNHVNGIVSAANFNSPGQVVIAGSKEAVDAASEACTEAGARRVVPLDVSVPSHCGLMESAAAGMSRLLESAEIKVPRVDVYQNVVGEIVSVADAIRSNLVDQIKSPVLWYQSISSMIRDGASIFYECGPGKVLTGLMRRIDRSAKAIALGDLDTFNKELETSS